MKNRPKIVTLCGSTRFGKAFVKAQYDETLAGNIVLTIGCNMKTDIEIFGDMPKAEYQLIKAKLEVLHLHKIALSDEILVLNVSGYIGEDTQREIEFAKSIGVPVRYLETVNTFPEIQEGGIK